MCMTIRSTQRTAAASVSAILKIRTAIILMIAFQSIRVGLIGLIPNLMPAIFVGGFMGWMGIPLDMMTATLIPMMLGMAVDDTIHFFNHSKLEFDRKPNYSFAIRRTFRVVGVAIVTTSIITSAVFATFATRPYY